MPPSIPRKQRRPIAPRRVCLHFNHHAVFYGRSHRPDVPQSTASNKDIIDQVNILDAFDAYANVGHSYRVKPSRADAWRRIGCFYNPGVFYFSEQC